MTKVSTGSYGKPRGRIIPPLSGGSGLYNGLMSQEIMKLKAWKK